MDKKNKKEEICNHNPKDDNTTLKRLNRRTMVYPRTDEFICKMCHQFFEFRE